MLYLIKVCHSVFTYYKVGTTTDIDRRFSQYQAHVPECELISTRPGGEVEENIINKFLHTYPEGYWEYHKSEWYKCVPGDTTIETLFGGDLESMKKVIWENRKKVLSYTNKLDVDLWADLNGNRIVTRTIPGPDGNLILNEDWDFDKNFYIRSSQGNNAAKILLDPEVKTLVEKLESMPVFDAKFRLYCESREKFKSDPNKTTDLMSNYLGTDLENLYSYFGFNQCLAVGFKAVYLKRKLSDQLQLDPLKTMICGIFKVKERYTLKYIKEILGNIYQKIGLFKNPKASDIEEFFNTKRVKIPDKTNKKITNGYQLLSIK